MRSSACRLRSVSLLLLLTAYLQLTTNFLTARVLANCAEGQRLLKSSWLSAYKALHRRGAKKLKAGKDVQVLVYTCHSGCGGVGDRITGMLSAFYVAVATGRVFIIDHTSPVLLTTALLPKSIDWDLATYIRPHLKSETVYLVDAPKPMESLGNIMKAHLTGVQILRLQLNRYFVAMALWTPKQSLQAPSRRENIELIGDVYNSHMRFCSAPVRTKTTFYIAFHFLFRFSGEVLARAEGMYREVGFTTSQRFTGIHARLGGDVKSTSYTVPWEDPVRHAIDDLPKFVDCAKSKAWNTSVGDMPILVISDSPTFKIASQEVHGTTHINSTVLFHTDRSSSDNETILIQGNVDTYAELLLLSRAHCIVGSHSGFSGTAAAISDTNNGKERCFCMFDDCNNDSFDYFETSDRDRLRFK